MIAHHGANAFLALSATIGIVCVIAWAAIARVTARAAPPGFRWRAVAVLPALLVIPAFVVCELWGLALALGRTWAPLPWIIAAGGALIMATIVPSLAAQSLRDAPVPRRRALTNAVLAIAACTAIGEILVFLDRSWLPWAAIIFPVAVAIQSVFARRAGRARARKTPAEQPRRRYRAAPPPE